VRVTLWKRREGVKEYRIKTGEKYGLFWAFAEVWENAGTVCLKTLGLLTNNSRGEGRKVSIQGVPL